LLNTNRKARNALRYSAVCLYVLCVLRAGMRKCICDDYQQKKGHAAPSNRGKANHQEKYVRGPTAVTWPTQTRR
jgi:hypothetical protein